MNNKNLNLTSELTGLLNRRSFLRRASMAAAALPIAGVAFGGSRAQASSGGDNSDIETLNFALNLEYLEANYYLYATTGMDLQASGVAVTGKGTLGQVTGPSSGVNFSDPVVKTYAAEIAQDERNHVIFLRSALGSDAVAQPAINLTTSFQTLATAAGITTPFNPFADDISFLLGAFIFEDVGVTAYHGAAPTIHNKTYLSAAAGILAVEAYHASEVRTILYGESVEEPSLDIVQTVQMISNLRNKLGGAGLDQGIVLNGMANIVPTDSNSIAFSRTPREVLNIVYGAVNASKGLFFPDGINEYPSPL